MYFIDIQGTLITDTDKTPIEGAIAFIDKLNATNTPYVLITNNTKKSSHDFVSFLCSLGFAINEAHYIDPLMSLKKTLKETAIAPYGTDEFIKLLPSLGYAIDFKNPEAVVVAIKHDFNADEYAQMIEFLLQGAKLVGMHETSIYAKNNKRYPGVGAILKMLQFATQKNYTVVGKPSAMFYKQALQKLQQQNPNATFDQITIISDDVTGDLVGAKKLGMKTIFVTSGKYKNSEEILPQIEKVLQPDLVKANISELL
jgi:NagD protein